MVLHSQFGTSLLTHLPLPVLLGLIVVCLKVICSALVLTGQLTLFGKIRLTLCRMLALVGCILLLEDHILGTEVLRKPYLVLLQVLHASHLPIARHLIAFTSCLYERGLVQPMPPTLGDQLLEGKGILVRALEIAELG